MASSNPAIVYLTCLTIHIRSKEKYYVTVSIKVCLQHRSKTGNQSWLEGCLIIYLNLLQSKEQKNVLKCFPNTCGLQARSSGWLKSNTVITEQTALSIVNHTW